NPIPRADRRCTLAGEQQDEYMTGKCFISIGDFIEKLRSFEQSPITRDGVLDFCSSVQITDSSLHPFVFFDDKFYTRNFIYHDDLLATRSDDRCPHAQRPALLDDHATRQPGRG